MAAHIEEPEEPTTIHSYVLGLWKSPCVWWGGGAWEKKGGRLATDVSLGQIFPCKKKKKKKRQENGERPLKKQFTEKYLQVPEIKSDKFPYQVESY